MGQPKLFVSKAENP